jgi:hypothetical protein
MYKFSLYDLLKEGKSMVRLLGRISDKRIFFQDSYTIIDHGTTVGTGGAAATAGYLACTNLKSVIWGWIHVRSPPGGTSVLWLIATSGAQLVIKSVGSVAYGYTIDWYAFGYTS